MEMTVDYLPIGSVVLLEDGEKELMITGFCTVPEETPNYVYDYCGCLYPEGVLSSDEIYVFNHDQISDILFVGYENEAQKEYKQKLIENAKDIYAEDDSIEEETNEENKPLISIEEPAKIERL